MEITNQMHEAAMSAIKADTLNDRSLNGWLSQYVGQIGEQAAMRLLDESGIKYSFHGDKCYEYDIESYGIKFDVKSKARSGYLSTTFEHSIPQYSESMVCDCYIFANVLISDNVAKQADLMGYCGHEWLWKTAFKTNKGDVRENGMVSKADNAVITYDQLLPIDLMITRLKARE